MSLLSSTWLIYRAQLAGVIRTRRALICFLLAALPVALAIFISFAVARHEETVPARLIGWIFQVQVLVPLLALVLGSTVVAGEVEDRTMSYLFTRPIPRAALLLGRWLAVVSILLVLQLGSAAATVHVLRTGFPFGSPTELPAALVGPLLVAVALGTITYSALFAALGTLVKYPMIFGLGYVFAFEALLSNLPGNSQGLTIQYYLRCYAWHAGADTWRGMEAFPLVDYDPAAEAVQTLVITTAVALLAGARIVSRKQYVLPA